MAKVPIPDERVVFQGVNFAPAPPVRGGQLPISQALTQWAAERRRRLNQEINERIQDEATLAQRALGTSGLASPSDDLNPEQQEIFNQQARAVFGASVQAEALDVAMRLSREHQDDPEAFAQAYNAWMAPQVQALTDADPSESEPIRLKLEDIGRRSMAPLLDRQQAKAQQQSRLDFDNGIRSQLATFQDALRSNPDETLLSDALEQMEGVLQQGFDSGLLSPEEFQRRVSDLRVDLPRNYAIGRFDAALARGDVSGARAIIDRLEAGGLFDDNDAGLTTASLLRERLNRRMAEVEGVSADQLAIWREDLRAYANLVNAGIKAELPEEAINGLVAHGKPSDREFVKQLQVTLAVRQALGETINDMGLEDIEAAREQLADKATVLDPNQVGAIVEMLNEREKQLNEALSTGDFLSLVQPSGLEPLAQTQEERKKLQQQAASARQKAAIIAGVPVDLVSPRTDAQVKEARERFERARMQRDFGAMQQVIERFLQPVLGNPFREFALAQRAGSPDMQAFSMILPVAGPEIANTIFAMSEQGARVRNDDLRRQVMNKLGESILTIADAYSFGDSAVRETLIATLRDTAIGLAVDAGGELTSRAKADFLRLVDPLSQTVKLENGHHIPRAMLGDDIQAKTLVREINKVLKNPQETFGVFAEDSLFLRSVRPIPGPSGQIMFTSSLQPGALLTDPATGKVIMTNAAPKIEEARRKASEKRGFFDFLRPNVDPSGQLNTDAMSTMRSTVPAAAKVTGAEQDLLEAMFRAAQSVPIEQRAGRDPAFLLSPASLKDLDRAKFEAAWKAAHGSSSDASGVTLIVPGLLAGPRTPSKAPAPKDPMTNRLAAAIAVGVLQQQYLDRFHDADKALAAMWVGADAVEEAVRKFGDRRSRWKQALPDEALEYMRRVKDRL